MAMELQVKRSKPELVAPAEPTPYEVKNLSTIDNQKSFQLRQSLVNVYSHKSEMEGRDPAKVIKEAVAKALVHYYPFAGRLRKWEGEAPPNSDKLTPVDNLVVECTGEGVMFIEADAAVNLDHLGDVPQPPFSKDLLYDGPGSDSILSSPLLLIQVTRFLCGGFVFAIHYSHTVSDAIGIGQFIKTVGEMACGASVPSVAPVWERERLHAQDQQPLGKISHKLQDTDAVAPFDITAQLTCRSFFFGSEQISAIRNQLPHHLHGVSRFDLLSAFLWKCRTITLSSNSKPSDKVAMLFAVSARKRFDSPLPVGYYGNCIASPMALSTVEEVCQNPLSYSVELIRKAKREVTVEFMRAYIDALPTMQESLIPPFWYYVSDMTGIGFECVDFGWGKAVYGGHSGNGDVATFLMTSKNNKGEDGVVATICLPEAFMDRLIVHIDKMICEPSDD